MPQLPKSPRQLTQNVEIAVNALNNISFAADSCVADPASVKDLFGLLRAAKKGGDIFTSLAADGFPAPVLGPQIVSTLGLPADWSAYEPSFTALKTTHIPALVTWAETNKAAILATADWTSDMAVYYNPLPSNLATEVTPLLANIADSYAA